MSQMTNETRKLLNHEKLIAKRVLSKLHGQAWLSQIAMIKDEETRIRVANIVWWDFFGDKMADCSMPADERAKLTAQYTKRMDAITLNVRIGLEKVGYTHEMAVARMGKTAQEKLQERMYRNRRVRACQAKKGDK